MKNKPVRIQRKRVKGWTLKDASPNELPTVCVNRGTAWGNPFQIGPDGTRDEVLQKYRNWLLPYQSHQTSTVADYLTTQVRIEEIKTQLRGKNLACFCKLTEACHGDILLQIANED